jgi:hypothetical protein
MADKNDKQAQANIKAAQKQSAEQTAAAVEANSALKVPTASATAAAQAEGVKEAIKESAKDTYKALTDGALPGDPPVRQFTGMDDIMQYAPVLDLDPDPFVDAVARSRSQQPDHSGREGRWPAQPGTRRQEPHALRQGADGSSGDRPSGRSHFGGSGIHERHPPDL